MLRSSSFRLAASLCLCGCITGAYLAHAGSLAPPAGPVVATMKTLEQVEPRIPISASTTPGDADSLFKISAPGSYYLTGNITGVAGKHGIEIGSTSVTIDLMGFNVNGVAGSLDGVNSSGFPDTKVRNGRIGGWGGNGVRFSSSGLGRIEQISITGNAGWGIDTSTCNSIEISHCTINGNGGAGAGGINTGALCVVSDCIVRSNNGSGIVADDRTIVRNCHVSINTGHGIVAGSRAIIVSNVSMNNISLLFPAAGIDCASDSARIDGNTVSGNSKGIQAMQQSNIISRNFASGNTTNYEIAAGNVCFAIVTPVGAGISGSSGGVSSGTSDPLANFSY